MRAHFTGPWTIYRAPVARVTDTGIAVLGRGTEVDVGPKLVTRTMKVAEYAQPVEWIQFQLMPGTKLFSPWNIAAAKCPQNTPLEQCLVPMGSGLPGAAYWVPKIAGQQDPLMIISLPVPAPPQKVFIITPPPPVPPPPKYGIIIAGSVAGVLGSIGIAMLAQD